jgi:hypothetical protein
LKTPVDQASSFSERFSRKLSSFCEYQTVFKKTEQFSSPPLGVSTILHFAEFCKARYFKFLNSVLIKNLEIHSSFLDFLFQNFVFFNFKFDRSISSELIKLVPTGFAGSQKNRPVFNYIVNHGGHLRRNFHRSCLTHSCQELGIG